MVAAITVHGLEVHFKKIGVQILVVDDRTIRCTVQLVQAERSYSKRKQEYKQTLAQVIFLSRICFAESDVINKSGSSFACISELQEPCEACFLGKHQRKMFPHESRQRIP